MKFFANHDYFSQKLWAEKARSDVLHAVKGEQPFDFTLLDTRGRQAFVEGHIPGAICAPLEELEQLAHTLPMGREIVTYCSAFRKSGSAVGRERVLR